MCFIEAAVNGFSVRRSALSWKNKQITFDASIARLLWNKMRMLDDATETPLLYTALFICVFQPTAKKRRTAVYRSSQGT